MDFNQIKQDGYWKDAAESLNDNFNKISVEIDNISEKTERAKGLFSTLERLKQVIPNPKDGDWAYVGTSFPASIYLVEDGEWVTKGGTGGGSEISLKDYLQSTPVSDISSSDIL